MAYQTITVFGAAFQLLLLASSISDLMLDNGRSSCLVWISRKRDSHTRMFAMSQPLYLHSSTNLFRHKTKPTVFSHRAGRKTRFSLGLLFFPHSGIIGFILYLKANKVWAVPDSLATTTGIVVYFLFLALLRCFSSGGYLLPILCVQIGVIGHYSNRVSPFGHLRLKTYLAVPRSFSQLITSFFGITCQGILCARLSNFLRLVMRQT